MGSRLDSVASMRPTDFLHRIPDAVRDRVAPSFATFHAATRFSLAQIWYGNRALHYETWIRGRLRVVEIGLHFEADELTNARLLAAFGARRQAVRRALGDDVRIEDWDRGWARVWEPISLGALDDALLTRLGDRLAAYIDALEPILRDELPAGVAWAETGPRKAQRARAGSRAKQRR